MNRLFLTVSFLVLGILNAFSIENYPSGARALALSNAFVSFVDTWSTVHNQAGLAGLTNISAGFYYESRFQVKELSMTAGTFVLPTGTGNFALSFFQFGKGSFKENKFGFSYSKKLSEKLYAGVQLDYFSQLLPENKRSKGFATFEGGLIYLPSENLYLGVHVFNPVSAGIKSFTGEQKMSPVYRFGGHYQFNEMVLVSVETEKDTKNPLLIKTGIEIAPAQNLALRFGISGKPYNYTTGIGYQFHNIITDIGFSYHGNLGVTPSVSIQFVL